MATVRARLWPRNRLAVALLLYLIWIPLIVQLAVSTDEHSEAPDIGPTVDEERNDFADRAGWTWAVLWLGYASLAAWLARIKGRDPIRWGIASLLTFIALFPFLAVAPERSRG